MDLATPFPCLSRSPMKTLIANRFVCTSVAQSQAERGKAQGSVTSAFLKRQWQEMVKYGGGAEGRKCGRKYTLSISMLFISSF